MSKSILPIHHRIPDGWVLTSYFNTTSKGYIFTLARHWRSNEYLAVGICQNIESQFTSYYAFIGSTSSVPEHNLEMEEKYEDKDSEKLSGTNSIDEICELAEQWFAETHSSPLEVIAKRFREGSTPT